MNNLKNLLQDSDPLRHEPARFDAHRDRVRDAILRETADGRELSPTRVSRRAAAAALAASVLVIAGYATWVTDTPVIAAVRFEVRLAENQPREGLVVARVGADPAHLVYLHSTPVVGNDDIAQSWVVDDGSGQFAVSVEFLPAGADRMRQATRTHEGRPMAVLIDGRVVMAPVVRSEISTSAVITGDFSRAEAERVAEGISRR
jgi:preprotein translocase subunit SecD